MHYSFNNIDLPNEAGHHITSRHLRRGFLHNCAFIRPSREYGSEVWEGNKGQTNALESVILEGAKKILGCSSKTCNEAVRGDMGLETLKIKLS